MKKNPMQFTIRFNGSITPHKEAAALLNQCGHMKAHFIAAAIAHYMANGGELPGQPGFTVPEVPDAGVEAGSPAAQEPAGEAGRQGGADEPAADADHYDLMDEFDDTDMENILASMTMMGNIDDSY